MDFVAVKSAAPLAKAKKTGTSGGFKTQHLIVAGIVLAFGFTLAKLWSRRS